MVTTRRYQLYTSIDTLLVLLSFNIQLVSSTTSSCSSSTSSGVSVSLSRPLSSWDDNYSPEVARFLSRLRFSCRWICSPLIYGNTPRKVKNGANKSKWRSTVFIPHSLVRGRVEEGNIHTQVSAQVGVEKGKCCRGNYFLLTISHNRIDYSHTSPWSWICSMYRVMLGGT